VPGIVIFDLAETGVVWAAIVGSGSAIALILVFVVARRWVRERHFRKRDRIAVWARQNWDAIVACRIPPLAWRSSPLTRQVVEEIALDRMAVAAPEEAGRLGAFLRDSGVLDQHKHAAQRATGWGRRLSIQVLGRVRDLESLPLLIQALEDPSDEIVFQTIHALGSIGGPETGAAIVARLTRPLVYAPAPVEAALVNCFRHHPEHLIRAAREATGTLRSMLLRVLAEVATADLSGDVIELTADPDADVRASAARILAVTRQAGAATALCRLAADPEWFVRLRAMVALGGLQDPYTIPSLIQGLCDRNRLVRLRAASSLAGMDCLHRVLRLVDSTGDRYALQVLVSELERAGKAPAPGRRAGRGGRPQRTRDYAADGPQVRLRAHAGTGLARVPRPQRAGAAPASPGTIGRTICQSLPGKGRVGAATGPATAFHGAAAGDRRGATRAIRAIAVAG